jgi:outer membrane protein OmpA-like peptidoglycan-associated protein
MTPPALDRLRGAGRLLAAALLCLPLSLAHAGDRDDDGIPNKLDRCPDEPEDRDGYQDDDGCRDPATRVHLVVQDGAGRPVEGAASALVGAGGQGTGGGDWLADVHHGVYTLTVRAEGFRPLEDQVVVPELAEFEVRSTLDRLEGRLRVTVQDEGGRPIPGSTVAVGEAAPAPAAGGAVAQMLRPGDHLITVRAPGFLDSKELATVLADGDHALSVVLEPRVRDQDGDGVIDSRDACPDQPEDVDGFDDADGCPDPVVRTAFQVVDGVGRAVPGVQVRVMGAGGDGAGGAAFSLDLHPGDYQVFAAADSFVTTDQTLTVPAGADQFDARVVMDRVWATLILYVMDDKGQPIDAFWWNLDNSEDSPGDGQGLYAGKMDPGAHMLFISAKDHAPAKARVLLEPGKFSETSITLFPTLIEVTRDKIEISDKVYFDTGKATIRPESYPLLDQVLAVLQARTDLLRLRIEGHTDARGSADANRRLSDERAAAVRAYLLNAGISPERLTSVGVGEDQPVDDRDGAEAWERNRRVEFMIEAWSDETVEREIEPREAVVEVKTTDDKPPLWPGFGILDGSPPPIMSE